MPTGKHITKDQRKEIQRLLKEGFTATEICEKTKVSRGVIYNISRQHVGEKNISLFRHKKVMGEIESLKAGIALQRERQENMKFLYASSDLSKHIDNEIKTLQDRIENVIAFQADMYKDFSNRLINLECWAKKNWISRLFSRV